MVDNKKILEHSKAVELARQHISPRCKYLWQFVLFGISGTSVIKGYTYSVNPAEPQRLFTISAPSTGANLLALLDEAGVWSTDVVGVVITAVETVAVRVAAVGFDDLTWGNVTSDARMSKIAVGDYTSAEVLINVVT